MPKRTKTIMFKNQSSQQLSTLSNEEPQKESQKVAIGAQNNSLSPNHIIKKKQ